MDGGSRGARRHTDSEKHRPFRWSRTMLVVHNWLGLKLFLILAVVFVSGTLAVFRWEIDWLIYPEMRVEPGERLASLDDILAAVKRAYPEMGLGTEVPTGVGAGNLAIGLLGVSPDRGIRMIWVDPYRAIVQGDTPLMTPGFFLASLHRDLFIPDWGLLIVCATAIVLVVSLVTGLIAYRRFWRGFFRRPRFRTLRLAMVDLHKLVGLWSLWFIIVIALTGLWYFWVLVGEPMFGFPQAVARYAPPEIAADRVEAFGPETPRTVPIAEALARAQALHPDFAAGYVSLPEHHGGAYVFHGNRGEALARYATTISVDPYTGDVLGVDLARDAPALARIGAMVNPLHYGDFAGMWSKTIWFLFGLAVSGLAVTGIVIFWCRTASATAGLLPATLRAFHPWRGAMAWLKPLNWAVLALSIAAAGMTAQFYASRLADAPARYAPQAVGPWRIGATLIAGIGDSSDPRVPGRSAIAVVEYCADCWKDIRRLWVAVGATAPSGDEPGQRVKGQPGFAFGGVVLPEALDSQLRLWLIAEGWDRRRHLTSWPLGGGATAQ